MVIDASKGVEAQTRKLFKVCTMRHIPIFTFINKMDREAMDTFEPVSYTHLAPEVTKTFREDSFSFGTFTRYFNTRRIRSAAATISRM